ncbi:MAG: VanZ family protein [Verrucomicrobiales bacterium]
MKDYPTPAPVRSQILPRLAGAVWVLWLATLWVLSAQSLPAQKLPDFQFSDKFAHFGYFFLGGSLLAIALRDVVPVWRKRVLLIIAASALIGAGDEYHQSFVKNRYGNDPWDWLADTIGGTAAALLVNPRLKRRIF